MKRFSLLYNYDTYATNIWLTKLCIKWGKYTSKGHCLQPNRPIEQTDQTLISLTNSPRVIQFVFFNPRDLIFWKNLEDQVENSKLVELETGIAEEFEKHMNHKVLISASELN